MQLRASRDWRVFHAQGAHDKAAEYYTTALELRQRIYGEDSSHTSITDCYEGLGNVEFDRGSFEKALGFFERALAMRVGKYGDGHPSIGKLRERIGKAQEAKMAVGGFW